MTVTTNDNITEKRMGHAECRDIYGTTDVQELNRKFAEDAQRATDGNCSQWAIYAGDSILVVTEC